MVDQKLQESNVRSAGEHISHRECSFNYNWEQERLLTLSTMRRRICGSSKALLRNSSLCKFYMGQISKTSIVQS